MFLRPYLRLGRGSGERPIGWWLAAAPVLVVARSLGCGGASYRPSWLSCFFPLIAPSPCAGRVRLYNDIVDRELDRGSRAHRDRPLPSGRA